MTIGMVNGLNDLIDFMQDLGFEASLITQVESILLDSEEAVAGARKVEPIAELSFGDVLEGVELAEHTRKARATVRDALLEMMAGLASYRDGLTTLVEHTNQVEDNTVAALRKLEQGESCVDRPSFASPSQCTAPTTEEG